MRRRDSCADCPVRRAALCQTLANDQLLRLDRTGYRRRHAAGSVIASEDQPQDWFATVLTGVVKLTRTLSDGRRQIVGLLFPSDFFGRPFSGHSPCAAEAATPVELCCVSRNNFGSLMHETPPLKQLFLERTLREVDAARDWMLLLGRKTAGEKMATLLLLFARRMRPAEADGSQKVQFDLPLSRTEMAEYLGLRVETVSRQIRELHSCGVIEIAGGRGIRIPSMAALERMADGIQH